MNMNPTLSGRLAPSSVLTADADDTATGFRLTADVQRAASSAASTATSTAAAAGPAPLLVKTGGAGNDTLDGSSSADTLSGAAGNDTLRGLAGNDSLDGGTGNDSLDGGAGNDTMVGGTGNDIYIVDVSGDVTTETSTLATEIDTVVSGATRTLGANLENLTLSGSSAINGTGNALNNKITGNGATNNLGGSSGNDTLLGLGGNDSLDGGTGNDSLDGGTGNDILVGGAGNDTYVVDSPSDFIIEAGTVATEIDSVVSSQTLTLGANLENLTLTGSSAIRGIGNALANTLTGNSGANVLTGDAGHDTLVGGGGNDSLSAGSGNDSLDGGSGADTLVGGTGNDTYIVDSAGDVTTESSTVATEIDTVISSVTRTLSSNIERLTLSGTDPVDGTGNTLANLITGNSGTNTLDGREGNDTLNAGGGSDSLVGGTGNDSLNGGAGNDTMVGGSGNDRYLVDASNDRITEAGTLTTEIDSVTSSATYTLSANVENLTLTGTGNLNGTGNSAANSITGNSGNNSLAGANGSDTLVAGAGNDTLAGGSGNDRLDGGTGNDAMTGDTGSDTYIVDSAADTVVESSATGAGEIDTVISSVNWALGANLENLTLSGSAMLFASGNSLANKIIGNGAANLISAGGGGDSVDGGAGSDTVLGGAGSDSLNGGSEADELDGGDGGDSLDGGLGNDVMEGGSGNDIYVVDAAGDVTRETSAIAGEIDTVRSSITHTLGDNIENLALTGAAAINGTGNALNNVIEGNSGLNQLNGGEGNDTLFSAGGNDTMTGGAGDDDFYVASASDFVVELQDGGTDWLNTALATYSLVELGNVENLTNTGDGAVSFTGNALNNQIYGGGANDTLNGAAGNDTLVGGAGSDLYTVDAAGDVVQEDVDSGLDDVIALANAYTLSDNVERLYFMGSGDFAGTGNASDNYLESGDGRDTLDGGGGNDTMVGRGGIDFYTVDSTGDVVTEAVDGGYDTINTTLTSYTLGGNLEDLNYLGSSGFTGFGNTLANVLYGNTGDDSLSGDTGNDALIGKAGNDTLDGGTGNDYLDAREGNDTYVVDSAGDVVEESSTVASEIDTVLSGVAFTLGSNVENLTLSGTSSLNGTGNSLANVLIGNTAANSLSGGAGNDTVSGGDGVDTLRGGDGLDRLTGGTGGDQFIIDSFGTAALPKTTSDTITDFVSGTDKFGFVPSNGDFTVNLATTISTQGLFQWSGANELVVFTENAFDLSTTSATNLLAYTALFQDAGGGQFFHFATGATMLVAIDNGVDTAVYRFEDTLTYALGGFVPIVFAPGQLTLLATLQGTAATSTSDYFFTPG